MSKPMTAAEIEVRQTFPDARVAEVSPFGFTCYRVYASAAGAAIILATHEATAGRAWEAALAWINDHRSATGGPPTAWRVADGKEATDD